MAKGWRGILVALAIVAWAFVVYLNYYITHKPFTLSVAMGLLDSLGNLAVFLLMAAAALGVGRWATRGLEYPGSLSEIVFSLGLGWGIISLATFVLGLVGLLHGGPAAAQRVTRPVRTGVQGQREHHRHHLRHCNTSGKRSYRRGSPLRRGVSGTHGDDV